ncbi:MAG: PKD domain-containing protein [Elusimicrobiota bacterium]
MNRLWPAALLAVLFCWQAPRASAQGAGCEVAVQLEIPRKTTLEREAFDASLTLVNSQPSLALEYLKVDIRIKHLTGGSADDKFFIKVTQLQNVNAADGTGTVQPSTQADVHWLIIPSTGAGGTNPLGTHYAVNALISFINAGSPRTVKTFDAFITVKPQPVVRMEYMLPFEVFGDELLTVDAVEEVEPFLMGVRVTNVGYGPAHNLAIDSGQTGVVGNESGMAVDIRLLGTYLQSEEISNTLQVPFGDIPAGEAKTAAWLMSSNVSGRVERFEASFTHSAELGGELTSLVQGVETYTLIKDVLVDLPGRDDQFDFLINTTTARGDIQALLDGGGVLEPDLILEADQPNPVAVANLPSSLEGELTGTNPTLTLRVQGVVPMYVNKYVHTAVPAPLNGAAELLSVRRDDGRQLDPRNFWISKHFNISTLQYSHHLHILDFTSTSDTYLLSFASVGVDLPPDAVADLAARTGESDGELFLDWTAPGEDGSDGDILAGQIRIERSLNAGFDPIGATVELATNTAAGAPQEYALAEITGNATHHVRLFVEDTGGNASEASNIASAYALPNPPDALVAVAKGHDSLTVGWNGGDNGEPIVSEVSIMAAADGPALAASGPKDFASLQHAFTGLTPNTEHFFKGASSNPDTGVSSSEAGLGSLVTLAAPPEPGALTDPTVESFRASWGAAGNPAGTWYEAQASLSEQFTSVEVASGTYEAGALFSGLTQRTTYYVRVKARNSLGEETPYTSLGYILTKDFEPPAPGEPALEATAADTLVARWTSNGNLPGALYRAELSKSEDFATVERSSETLDLSASFGGLEVNTRYHARVSVYLASISEFSGFTWLGSSYTLPAQPGVREDGTTFTDVTQMSFWIHWTSGTPSEGYNPPNTQYWIELSSTTEPWWAGVSSGTFERTQGFSGLDPQWTYYARVKAVNGDGVSSAYTPLGGAPPTVSILNDIGGAYLISPSTTIAVSFSGAGARESLAFTLDDEALQAEFLQDGASYLLSGLFDGEHSIRVAVEDETGATAEDSAGFTVDTASPTLTVTQPAGGSYISDPRPEVRIDFSDTDIVTDTFHAAVDGQEIPAEIIALDLAGASFTVPSDLADGAHAITASMKDTAGNEGSVSSGFTVDTAPPEIAVAEPGDGAYVGTARPPVAIDFSDPHIVTETFRAELDGETIPIEMVQLELTGASFIPAQELADGEHTLTASIKDLAGNEGAAGSSFRVDTTAPLLFVSSPAPNANGWHNRDITFRYTAEDPPSADGLPGSGLDAEASKLDADVLTDESPNLTAEALAVDNVGNRTPFSETGIKLDKTPPVLTITSPAGGEYVATRDEIVIDFTVLDNFDAAPGLTARLELVEERNGASGKLSGPVEVESGQKLEPLDLTAGLWRLTLSATDQADNPMYAAGASFEIIHDITPPRTSVAVGSPRHPPVPGEGEPDPELVYLTGTTPVTASSIDDLVAAEDATGLGVATQTVKVNGDDPPRFLFENPEPAIGTAFENTFTLDDPDGELTLLAEARDTLDNQETGQALSLQIDNTPPTLSHAFSAAPVVRAPKNEEWFAADFQIIWSAYDGTGSGVASVDAATKVTKEEQGGSYTGRAIDNVENEGSLTVTVNLDKTAPVVDAGPDLTVEEGSELAFSATVTDNLDEQAVYGWTFGDGETAGQEPAPAHTYADEGIYEAAVSATDHAGHPSSDSLIVTVTNASPIVTAGADQIAEEGSEVGISATFTDAGVLDTHTAEVDWGDGTTSPADLTQAEGSGSLTARHVYADNDVYTAKITVTDNDDDSGEATLEVTVTNVEPTIAAGEARTVSEGAVISLAPAAFNDKGTLDTHTATIDWGDGTAVEAGAVTESPFGPPGSVAGVDGSIALGSHVYADNGLYTAEVCVTDDDNATTCGSFAVTVTNVAPTIAAGADQTVDEAATIDLDPATFNDKGTLDTHTATVDWGDGTAMEAGTVSESPFGPPGDTAGQDGTIANSHVYSDNGSYTVRVCVKDDDAHETCDHFTATVENAAPTVAAGADQTAAEGGVMLVGGMFDVRFFEVYLPTDTTKLHRFPAGPPPPLFYPAATFTDNGADTHTATINWGDGTSDAGIVSETPPGPPGSSAGVSGEVSGSHTYGENGVFILSVTVTDDDGAAHSDSLDVTVDRVPPLTEPSYLGSYLLGADLPEGVPQGVDVFLSTATEIALIAEDVESNGIALGVERTYYRDGTTGPFTLYTGPFRLAEGVHSVEFFSVDVRGNEEEHKQVSLAVDGTTPQTTLHVGKPSKEEFGQIFISPRTRLELSAFDPESTAVMTGLKGTYYTIDDGEPIRYDTNVATSAFTVQEGTHTVRCWSLDNVDNIEAVQAQTFNVSKIVNQRPSAGAGKKKSIDFSGTMRFTGDVLSNGALTVSGNVVVDGDTFAPEITVDGNSVILGSRTIQEQPLYPNPFDLEAIKAAVEANDLAKSTMNPIAAYLKDGVLALNAGASLRLPSGDYLLKEIRVTGDAELQIEGDVGILVEGPITITGGLVNTESTTTALSLFCNQETDIRLTGGRTGAFIYAPDATTTLSGNAQFGGKIFTGHMGGRGTSVAVSSATVPGAEPEEEPEEPKGKGKGGKTASAGAASGGADPSFVLRDLYVFPNPAVGGAVPTIHVAVGIADKVTLRIYNIAGQQVHQATLEGTPPVIDDGSGPKYAYEYAWDGRIPSGVYLYTIVAEKSGEAGIRKAGKFAVVR